MGACPAQVNWQQVASEIALLKNTNDLLPLRSLSAEWWELSGMEQFAALDGAMRCYTQPARPGNVVIFPVMVAWLHHPLNRDSLLRELRLAALPNRQTVLLIFGAGACDEPPDILDAADAVVCSPYADSVAQAIAAQVLFGALGTNGEWGFASQTLGRLWYAPPEVVGMDGGLLADSVAAIVTEGIRAGAYPGAQVLIARKGCVVYHQAFGYHTYDSLQPLRTTDIYDVASVTKVCATLPALMKFYGEDRLQLDAPLKTWLPFLRNSNKGDIPLRRVLAHFGRLKPGIVFWRKAMRKNGKWRWRTFRDKPSHRYSIQVTDSLFLHRRYPQRMYKAIARQPLNDTLAYVYSDLPFILTPLLVEHLAGQPLERYLREVFYEPLGAHTMVFQPLRFFPPERIVPTERDTFFRRKQIHGTVHDENSAMLGGVSGHAGLFASANDLAKLFQLYLNGGSYGGQQFIAPEALAEFTRCAYCEDGNRRGLGFDKPPLVWVEGESYVARRASPSSFGHSGYTGAFVWADPESGLLVIFLSNRVYPDRSRRALYARNIRPRIHQVAYDAIIQK